VAQVRLAAMGVPVELAELEPMELRVGLVTQAESAAMAVLAEHRFQQALTLGS